jgi:hypothetical protein
MGLLHRKRDRERAAQAVVHDWLINATTIHEPTNDRKAEETEDRPPRPLRAKASTRG